MYMNSRDQSTPDQVFKQITDRDQLLGGGGGGGDLTIHVLKS